MRLLYVLLFCCNMLSAQQGVQIEILNSGVGGPDMNPATGGMTGSCQYDSNDAGLNLIFQNYNIDWYCNTGSFHPFYPGIQQDKIFIATYYGNQIDQVLSDLLAYNTVVYKVHKSPNTFTFADVADISLSDPNIGVPIGIINNIVETNDSTLNQIFLEYNVFYYSSFSSGNYSTLTCDCNIGELIANLMNANFINSHSDYTMVFLGDNEHELNNTIIYPNPFSEQINISTNEVIEQYLLVDCLGKMIISTTSKINFDNEVPKLNPGIYFLKLHFRNGRSADYKLIKN